MKRGASLLFAWTLAVNAWGQSGGTETVFTLGAGARGIGLGSAMVASVSDPTGIYWNPATLDHLERKSMTSFYTNLIEGAHYGFVGMAYPTINIGTFGLGLALAGAGGMDEYNEFDDKGDSFGYQDARFVFSYAKQLPYYMTLGVNFKLVRQAFGSISSASGFGGDLGVLFRPDVEFNIFQNTSIGLMIQNLVPPSVKHITDGDPIPLSVRFGVAKPVMLRSQDSKIELLFGMEKGRYVAPRLQLGTEYTFQSRALVRLGFNGEELTFGAGAIYQDFQLDYAFGKYAQNPFPGSHRISLTFEFGKSKDELIRLAQEERMRKIEEEAARLEKWQRLKDSKDELERGRAALEKGDLFRAYASFSKALVLDPTNPETEELLNVTDQKIKEDIDREATKRAEEERVRTRETEYSAFFTEHFEKGLSFMERQDYERAISEWEKALERDPSHPKAKILENWISQARTEMANKVQQLVKKAKSQAGRRQFREAIRTLIQAREATGGDAKMEKTIARLSNQYERRLDFTDVVRQGISYYRAKDYNSALGAFERALELEPKNVMVQKYFRDAKARAMAYEQEMPEKLKTLYRRGVALFRQGKFQEAIEVWEQILESQPYNKTVLKSIDMAIEQQKQ